MPRRAQGQSRNVAPLPRCRGALAPVIFLLLPLTACASGLDVGRLAADSSLKTSSVTGGKPPTEEFTDERAIARAMTEAETAQTGEGGIEWKNAATDAHGSIVGILSYTLEDGTPCRRFTTTRQRFDGVGLFRGEACRNEAGAWQVYALESQ